MLIYSTKCKTIYDFLIHFNKGFAFQIIHVKDSLISANLSSEPQKKLNDCFQYNFKNGLFNFMFLSWFRIIWVHTYWRIGCDGKIDVGSLTWHTTTGYIRRKTFLILQGVPKMELKTKVRECLTWAEKRSCNETTYSLMRI